MKCEQARLEIGADPLGTTPQLETHVAGCDDCRGYRVEMRRLEGDLALALQLPVAAVAGAKPADAAPASARPANAAPAGKGAGDAGAMRPDNVVPLRRVAEGDTGRAPGAHASVHGAPVPAARRWAFAAGVLLVGVLAASFLALQPRDALAAALVEHMADEPESWTQRQPLPQSALDLVLRQGGVRLDRVAAGEVVYANACFLRGRYVPHLVVNTARGPVTVLLLRGEAVKRRVPFDEGGYRGVLLPVPGGGGGIAVLARSGAGGAAGEPDIEATAAQVLRAIAWSEAVEK